MRAEEPEAVAGGGGYEVPRRKKKASTRAEAEHSFFYAKRMSGYNKVRCRGPCKNMQRIALRRDLANRNLAA